MFDVQFPTVIENWTLVIPPIEEWSVSQVARVSCKSIIFWPIILWTFILLSTHPHPAPYFCQNLGSKLRVVSLYDAHSKAMRSTEPKKCKDASTINSSNWIVLQVAESSTKRIPRRWVLSSPLLSQSCASANTFSFRSWIALQVFSSYDTHSKAMSSPIHNQPFGDHLASAN